MARSVKLIIQSSGNVHLTHGRAKRGYDGQNPVIEVTGVPDGISDDAVVAAYRRCAFRPTMHAKIPIAWYRIRSAEQGEIVQLIGRPQKDEREKSVRVNITLSPAALAILDARGAGRSQEIERLILESVSTPSAE